MGQQEIERTAAHSRHRARYGRAATDGDAKQFRKGRTPQNGLLRVRRVIPQVLLPRGQVADSFEARRAVAPKPEPPDPPAYGQTEFFEYHWS